MDAVLHAQRYGRGGLRLVDPVVLVATSIADHFEQIEAGTQGLANQQLEGAFGGFQLIALMLHLLDAVEQLAAGVRVQAIFEAVLLQLIEHVAAAGKIAQQHALAVADGFGRDVLVGGGIFQHGADVHAALVREGAAADIGLIVAHAADSPARR